MRIRYYETAGSPKEIVAVDYRKFKDLDISLSIHERQVHKPYVIKKLGHTEYRRLVSYVEKNGVYNLDLDLHDGSLLS